MYGKSQRLVAVRRLVGAVLVTTAVGTRCPAASGAVFADSVPDPGRIEVRVNAGQVIEPVNRRVFGVCAIYQPFDEAFLRLWTDCFDGASVRIWANTRFFDGGREDMSVCEAAWCDVMRFAQAGRFAERIAFCPFTHIARKARYVSERDNNLENQHQPSRVAAYVHWLNKSSHPGFPDGFGVTGWEVWNEPQFPASGAWSPDDYARYVLDCSAAIRTAAPGVEIGAALHEGDREWNRRMLGIIAARNPAGIDFAVSHPYDFFWIRSRRVMGDYYARVSGAEVLRAEKIRPHVRDIFEMGHGRWRLVCSEWNTHPPGYGKPWHVSTDMAVAVHVAAMFGVFWDEHVDSAQFFQLYGRGAEGHFSLVRRTANGPAMNPTGEVFRLYARSFRGERVKTSVDTPSWPYPDHPAVRVPVVFSQAAMDRAAGRLVIMLGNRHRDKPAGVMVAVRRFAPRTRAAECTCVTTDAPDSDQPRILRRTAPLPPGPDPTFKVVLPPHSVSRLTISGSIPPSGEELFGDRFRFVREWAVGSIVEPPAHTVGNAAALSVPTDAAAPVQRLSADTTGFLNLASLLEASGKAAALAPGFRAVAGVWVFSPVKRSVRISLGFDAGGVLDIDGSPVLSAVRPPTPPAPDQHRVQLPFHPGWNHLRARVISGRTGFGFWAALENTGDLIIRTDFAPPKWPAVWRVCADRGADVNSWEGRRNKPNPDRKVLEVSPPRPHLRRAYVAWPAPALPAGTDAETVTARIVLKRAYQRGDGNVWIRPVLEPWDPRTLTYDRQPRLGAPLPVRCPVGRDRWEFVGPEVDRLVRSWIRHPDRAFGIAVESDVEQYAAFWSDDVPDDAPAIILSVPRGTGPDASRR